MSPDRLQSHRGLRVWQRAMDLVIASHRVARRLPPYERYELASQLRRASVSVPSNIAEGYGRIHRGDYVHHLSIARGSLAEVDTLLDVCERLGYVRTDELGAPRELTDHTLRMATSLILRLRDH